MIRRGNLLEGLAGPPLAEEMFDTLLEDGAVTIERIVSTGQTAPESGWFDQPDDEWVCILEGAARVEIEGEADELTLTRGAWLFLPAHCRHRVTWTQADPPTVWLAVHIYPARR